MSQRILIVKPTALGDVAQASLVAPLIKRFLPECYLSWVVDSDYKSILELVAEIDEVIEFPRKRWRREKPVGEIWGWFRKLRARKFDTALDLQGLARSACMVYATGASRRIGLRSAREGAGFAYTEKIRDDGRHAVDRYRQAVSYLVGQSIPDDLFYHLSPPPPPIEWSLDSECYIIFHPYSLWDTKLWPWERYAQIAQALPDQKFVMVGAGPFFPLLADNIIDLRNRTSLTQLLSLLGHAKAVISTDSGPAHLAAALGRPIISLFGATDPHLTAPRSNVSYVLHGAVPCRPCLRRTCHYPQPMQCLEEVLVSRVVDALKTDIFEMKARSLDKGEKSDR